MLLLLSKQCEEDFIKFLKDRYKNYRKVPTDFFELPLAMQLGVYLRFFDQVNIAVNPHKSHRQDEFFYEIRDSKGRTYMDWFNSRLKMEGSAIKKAGKIYNENFSNDTKGVQGE